MLMKKMFDYTYMPSKKFGNSASESHIISLRTTNYSDLQSAFDFFHAELFLDRLLTSDEKWNIYSNIKRSYQMSVCEPVLHIPKFNLYQQKILFFLVDNSWSYILWAFQLWPNNRQHLFEATLTSFKTNSSENNSFFVIGTFLQDNVRSCAAKVI